MDKLVEWTVLAGETEVLGENLPRRYFGHHKSHLQDPGANPGRRGGKLATNRFSYDAATLVWSLVSYIKEECRQRSAETGVVRKIFGPKRKEVIVAYSRISLSMLFAKYYYNESLRRKAHERRCTYRSSVGKRESKRPLGRSPSRRERTVDYKQMALRLWIGFNCLRIWSTRKLLRTR
jgi:hypothetical protein